MKGEITEEYNAAIATAIATLNGSLSGEIASQIAIVNYRIDNEVATINSTIATLSSRVSALEIEVNSIKQQIVDILADIADMKQNISDLMKRIQSVTYIPKYSDGKATMTKNIGIDNGIAEFDFQISPKDAVADIVANWQSILSMKAVYTQTRAVSFVDLPILSCEADTTNGVITITASGENLSEDFYFHNTNASVSLCISSGNSFINSTYVDLFADVPAYYTIKYTTTDNTILIPNIENIADANIVSNSYVNGEGEIVFDDNITIINESAFKNCATLKTIVIPESVVEISSSAFYGCSELVDAHLSSRITTISPYLFYSCTKLASIEFPNDITSIDNYSFASCESLEHVIIPESVTQLVGSPFIGCGGLKELYIGANVELVGSTMNGFSGCTGVLTINCDIPDSGYYSIFCNSNFSKVIINGSSIGTYAFRGCTSIKELIIGDNVKVIGDYAFSGCTGLVTTTIGHGIISGGEEGYGMFDDCTGTVYMNSNVPDAPATGIWGRGFFGVSSFSKVIFGENVTYIGRYAFNNGPRTLYFKSSVPPVLYSTNIFENINSSYIKLYVPNDNIEAYKAAKIWANYSDQIFGYDLE